MDKKIKIETGTGYFDKDGKFVKHGSKIVTVVNK